MKSSPAFQFYPQDFWGDVHVQAMTYHEVGVYVKLLSVQWAEGSIPSDVDLLGRICKLPRRQFAKDWKAIQPCFIATDAGALVNPRLEREREVQRRFAERMSEAGRRGNAKRWQNGRVAIPERSPSDHKGIATTSLPNPQSPRDITYLPTVGTLSDVEPSDPAPKPKVTRLSPEVHGPDFGDLEPDVVAYLRIAADENKTRQISAGRIASLRRELQDALEKIGNREAFAYGLRTANAAGAPNANYVRKAAGSYRPGSAQSTRAFVSVPQERLAIYEQLERKARGEA